MKLRRGNPLADTSLAPNNNENVFAQFMQNPIQWLAQKQIDVPAEYRNDPHGAVQYLLNTGKMTQDQLNVLTQKANQLGIKLF